MDESNQAPSSPLSLAQLLEELENFIVIESQRNGHPWISMERLTELFYETYRVSPENVTKVQGYRNGLRNLLKSSRRFSIYPTQIPQEFYVALFQEVFPNFHQSHTSKVDKQEIAPYQPQRTSEHHQSHTSKVDKQEIAPYQPQRTSEHQPNLVAKVESANDLEIALIAIIKSLTANNPKKFVSLAVLSKKFCDYYQQPIRVVMRSVCTDMKLIELLQTIPGLHVQKEEDGWQVTLEARSLG